MKKKEQKVKIAGFQNLSMVDFPGHIAATIFLQGCNFKCPYCHNPDLVTTSQKFFADKKDIFEFLDRRKNMIDGVVLTGGEPSLYESLPTFVKQIKDKGFKVKLDTNGTNPNQLESLLEGGLVDYVAIDIKTSLEKYHLIGCTEEIAKKVKKSIHIIMLSSVGYEFRTTCAPGIVDEKDFYSIRETVKGARKFCLQQFQPINTYEKEFQKVRPYTKERMLKFKDILKDYVDEVEMRGL